MIDEARAVFLDASVLVARYIDEPRSEVVRTRCDVEPMTYTTPFCYYEAMNVFKAKWKSQQRIDFPNYRSACTKLSAWFGGIDRRGWVKDASFTDPERFRAVRDLVDRTELDFSDAFQIFSVKHGYFAAQAEASRVILATLDLQLATAARAEGLRVWNMELEESPT